MSANYIEFLNNPERRKKEYRDYFNLYINVPNENNLRKKEDLAMKKIREIRTATKCYQASANQYWQLSARGKSYELWDETNLLRRILTIPCKRVLWVFPF